MGSAFTAALIRRTISSVWTSLLATKMAAPFGFDLIFEMNAGCAALIISRTVFVGSSQRFRIHQQGQFRSAR